MTLHYSTWSHDSPDPCFLFSHWVMSDSFDPMDCSPPGSCPWDFPGKNNGLGCHFLLQRIFPTQILNPYFLHCRGSLYHWATKKLYFLGPALYFYFLEGEAPGNFDSRHLHSLSVYLRWSLEDLILKDCLECSYPAWTLMDQDPFLPGSGNLVQETGLPNRPFPNLLNPTATCLKADEQQRKLFTCRLSKQLELKPECRICWSG